MDEMPDGIDALRRALAVARRERDEARAEVAMAERRHGAERHEELRRLRNLFAVIRVIARRTADDVDSVEDYRGILDGRLSAYLGAQSAVASDWYKGSDLASLVAGQLLTFGLKEGAQVDIAGPPVTLTSRASVLLALAFHELAAAAVLSGRLEGENARLGIGWRREAAGALTIDWTERPRPEQEARAEETPRSSWANWIEEAIAHQLAGTMVAHADGRTRHATLRLPDSALCEDG